MCGEIIEIYVTPRVILVDPVRVMTVTSVQDGDDDDQVAEEDGEDLSDGVGEEGEPHV